MTSALQSSANKRNALKSVGPRSAEGKARSAQNAVRHGLRSELPVLPGEKARDWEEHQAGILRSLAPVGALEEALANRVALLLWRQRRVILYELGVTAEGLAEVEEARTPTAADPDLPEQGVPDGVRLQHLLEDLAERQEHFHSQRQVVQLLEALSSANDEAAVSGAVIDDLLIWTDGEFIEREKPFNWRNAEFLTRLGVPAGEVKTPWRWQGWTVGMVRQALTELACWHEADPEGLVVEVLAQLQQGQRDWEPVQRDLLAQAEALRRRVEARKVWLRQQSMLPNEQELA